MSLSTHKPIIPGVIPPLEYLEKYVVKDDGQGAHWFWSDGRRNHGHNSAGHAILKWVVKPTHKTNFVSRGTYCVARLFIEYIIGPIPRFARIDNTCRLSQCVNPTHWSRVLRLPTLRLAVVPSGAWDIVSVATGHGIQRPTPVRVRGLDGAVHVARVAPSFDRPGITPLVAACGAVVDVATALVVEDDVTCKAGC